MSLKRSCGILCHPTSMPGRFGIGELGTSMYRFIDFLVEAGQSIWQILPLGPTGYGDSPYQPFSAFAGNPLLIGLEPLLAEGLLDEEDVALAQPFPQDAVLYGPVIEFKNRALRRSYARFNQQTPRALRKEFAAFRAEEHAWLEDYALFMALKLQFNWAVWTDWEPGIALRQEKALTHWRRTLRDEVDYQCYLQFLFARQWREVKRYANDAGITLVGDVPIFMGHDSADVWSHRELFRLDEQGRPTVVAGVPPDYFSPTGQLWGNPLYRWDVLRADGYAWWLARLKRVFAQVDFMRLDHFRGFSGYWEVAADAETAIDGHWVKGPGSELFHAIERAFGGLPIIAEDLGLISADVIALREELGLSGMRVLQFGFEGDAGSPHLPHNLPRDCVIYTGTHDNDTTAGWYATRDAEVQHRVRVYTGTDGNQISWTFIRLAMNSVAEIALFPLQDVLGLGTEARLNRPGDPHGNWAWRYRESMLTPALADALRQMARVAGRWLPPDEELEDATPVVLEYDEPAP
jgi:4-alpha-glucanotransferase